MTPTIELTIVATAARTSYWRNGERMRSPPSSAQDRRGEERAGERRPEGGDAGSGSATSAAFQRILRIVQSAMPSASPMVQACSSFDHACSVSRSPGSYGAAHPSGERRGCEGCRTTNRPTVTR